MNTNDNQDYVIDTDGETSALTVPEKSEMAYVAPNEMPDLDGAEVGFSLEAKYLKFTTPNQQVRVVFNGFTTIRKNENGVIQPMTSAVLQNKEGLFLNSTSNVLDQLGRIPPGTAVQITYTGDEKSKAGYNVKKFDIRVLNVKTTPVIKGTSQTEKPAQTFPTEKVQPVYKNINRKDEYWKLAYEMRFTVDDGNDHLKEFDNDFAKAIEALKPGFIV